MDAITVNYILLYIYGPSFTVENLNENRNNMWSAVYLLKTKVHVLFYVCTRRGLNRWKVNTIDEYVQYSELGIKYSYT